MAPAIDPVWVSHAHARSNIRIKGKTVVAQDDAIRALITRRAGEPAANLFARPIEGSDGSIRWIDPQGVSESVALAQSPQSERQAAEAALRARLAEVEPLSADPALGAQVLAVLTVESPDAIRVANGRPIIAGWGGIPSHLSTAEDFQRHHDRTLGPYLSATSAPIPDSVETVVRQSQVGAIWRDARAALIASMVAAIVLLLLLLPGVLLRAAPTGIALGPPAQPGIDDGAANRALEREIGIIEGQLRGNVCRPSGELVPRIEAPPAPDVQGGNRSADLGPNSPAVIRPSAPPQATPPVRPEATPVPQEVAPSRAGQPQNLAALLNEATVLVVTRRGNGTGFFIAPNLILTNRHVVANPQGGVESEVLVGNKKLGRMVLAEVVATSPPAHPGEPDYALLRMQEGNAPIFLSLTETLPEQLQNVIAAGYPGVTLLDDADYRRLRENHDMSAVPDMAMTIGAVVQVQHQDTPVPVIVHRASISPGNSGGPLIDECGRVVGVNTFVAAASGAADRMHYALGTVSAMRFLRAHNIAPRVVAGRCVVGPMAATQPPTQPAPQPVAPAPAQPRLPPAAPRADAPAPTAPVAPAPPPQSAPQLVDPGPPLSAPRADAPVAPPTAPVVPASPPQPAPQLADPGPPLSAPRADVPVAPAPTAPVAPAPPPQSAPQFAQPGPPPSVPRADAPVAPVPNDPVAPAPPPQLAPQFAQPGPPPSVPRADAPVAPAPREPVVPASPPQPGPQLAQPGPPPSAPRADARVAPAPREPVAPVPPPPLKPPYGTQNGQR